MTRGQRSVVMIAERYWPEIGGVERHLERLCSLLNRRGYRTTVITSSAREGVRRTEVRDGTEIVRMPPRWSRVPPLATLWMFFNRRLWKRADIIHIHDTFPLLFWSLPILLSAARQRTAVTFHGYERDPVPSLFVFLRHVARRLVRRALCIGSFIEQCYRITCDYITLGATERVEVPKTEKREGGIIFVGQLRPDIGIDAYIRAMSILRDRWDVEQHLTIVGAGEAERELRELAESLAVDVTFTGNVADPRPFFRRASLCLAGGYLSILTAMSYGVPVIGYANTPLRYRYFRGVLDAGGPISIQTSPEGIARQIRRVMEWDMQRYASLVRRCVAFASALTWESLVDTYETLWESLLRPR